jgi:uncharacterized membrane protein YjjB (DUF3815 family)
MFLPAFWILVPGSVGVVGLSELVSDNAIGAPRDLQTTVGTIVAIVVGVVVGTALGEMPARSRPEDLG